MNLLLKHLKEDTRQIQPVGLNQGTEDIDAGKAFLMLKQSMNLTQNKKINNESDYSEKSIETVEFIEYSHQDEPIKNKYRQKNNETEKKVFSLKNDSQNLQSINFNAVKNSKTVYKNFIKSNYSFKINTDKKVMRSFTKGIFTRPKGITIRPYTRKRYTIRLNRTYASCRSLRAFRTYTAKLSSRRKLKLLSRKYTKSTMKLLTNKFIFGENKYYTRKHKIKLKMKKIIKKENENNKKITKNSILKTFNDNNKKSFKIKNKSHKILNSFTDIKENNKHKRLKKEEIKVNNKKYFLKEDKLKNLIKNSNKLSLKGKYNKQQSQKNKILTTKKYFKNRINLKEKHKIKFTGTRFSNDVIYFTKRPRKKKMGSFIS